MAKALKTVGMIAGVVVLSLALPGVGTGIAAALGTSVSTATAIATAVATVANIGATLMQKPPGIKMAGSINQVMIGANMPVPYAIGRTFVGGNKVFDDSGITTKYRANVFVYSGGGPIEEFQQFLADFKEVALSGTAGGLLAGTPTSGHYKDFLTVDSRKGLLPDTAVNTYLVDFVSSDRQWTSDHKLSGWACGAVRMKWDEKGKVWSSGIPSFGVVAKWVKVYDPRLDSTYPGGSGSHRWNNEATWAWSDNPALHALTYARGRFVNGVKVVGVGLSAEAIDIPAFVELANLCEANDWTAGGTLYEGPGTSKWENLKNILAAGAARPAWSGSILTLQISAPKVALDTITADDLADGEVSVQAMKTWRDKINTIVPRYRSEEHKWEYVQADAVSGSTYVTEDGETKTLELQWDLVQDVDQVAQLAAYEIVDRREFGPITLRCKPRMMLYRIGEALEVDLPEVGLDTQLAIITGRAVDPATGSIALTLESETTAKHAFALGKTGTAPPTPTIYELGESDNGTSNPTGLGENELHDDFFGPGWTLNSNWSRITPDTSDGYAAGSVADALKIVINSSVPRDGTSEMAAVKPSTRYYAGARFSVGTSGSTGGVEMLIDWFDVAGGSLGGTTPITVLAGDLTDGAPPKEFVVSAVSPSGAAFAKLHFHSLALGVTGHTYRVERPFLSTRQPGADVTTTVQGPAAADVFYDDSGTVFQSGPSLVYSLKDATGTITSGVTASYTVLSGTVNGRTEASGSQTITVISGVATLNLTSLDTPEAEIEVTLTCDGVPRTFQTVLTKQSAASVPVGGSSQTSGFGTIGTPYTSFVDITGSLFVTRGSTGTVRTVVNLAPKATGLMGNAGPWNIEYKLQRNIASVWTDVSGSTNNSNPDPYRRTIGGAQVAGTMTATIDETSVAAGTHEYKLVGRITTNTPSSNAIAFTGSVELTAL